MALVIFVGTLGASTLLKTDFLGSVSDDSSLTIKQELPAGTRLDTMSAAAEKVEAMLAADPDVKDYLTTIGGSIYAVAGTGANTAEITVNLNEGATADVVKPKLESEFAELGDTAGKLTVTQAANGSTSTDISVTVKGENSESLRKGAEQVQAALEGIPGLTNVTSNLAEQRKVLEVQVDHKKAADLGFTQAEIGQAVANALRGTKVGDVTLSGEQREVWVRTQDATDPSPADIGNLLLPVSQIQQAKAQKKASDKLEKRGDKLSDRQDALGDRQQAMGDEAAGQAGQGDRGLAGQAEGLSGRTRSTAACGPARRPERHPEEAGPGGVAARRRRTRSLKEPSRRWPRRPPVAVGPSDRRRRSAWIAAEQRSSARRSQQVAAEPVRQVAQIEAGDQAARVGDRAVRQGHRPARRADRPRSPTSSQRRPSPARPSRSSPTSRSRSPTARRSSPRISRTWPTCAPGPSGSSAWPTSSRCWRRPR